MRYYLNHDIEEVMTCKNQEENSISNSVYWTYKYMIQWRKK